MCFGLAVFCLLGLKFQELTCNPSPQQLWKCTLRQILGLQLQMGSLCLAKNTITTSLCLSNNTSSLLEPRAQEYDAVYTATALPVFQGREVAGKISNTLA
jgi:hypothetical protein